MKITFLGTGTSHGVPAIDCMLNEYAQCKKGVCKASLTDPKHNRTRSSILVEYGGKHILIDVTPDFRQQALRERIPKIDAVLITHCHSDHIFGIPDIRSYTPQKSAPLPFYGSAESMDVIRSSFSYIFNPLTTVGGGIPHITTNPIEKDIVLYTYRITCIPVAHGSLLGCLGYRIENIAYIPDVKELSEASLALLKDLDILIVNCLRETKLHATHLTLDESMGLARTLKPKKCFFIHMSHDIDYTSDAAKLEPWMSFSYDGLIIESGERNGTV